jgi:hypothetical protein
LIFFNRETPYIISTYKNPHMAFKRKAGAEAVQLLRKVPKHAAVDGKMPQESWLELRLITSA